MKMTNVKPTIEITTEEAKIIFDFIGLIDEIYDRSRDIGYDDLIEDFIYCYRNPTKQGVYFNLKIVNK